MENSKGGGGVTRLMWKKVLCDYNVITSVHVRRERVLKVHQSCSV